MTNWVTALYNRGSRWLMPSTSMAQHLVSAVDAEIESLILEYQ